MIWNMMLNLVLVMKIHCIDDSYGGGDGGLCLGEVVNQMAGDDSGSRRCAPPPAAQSSIHVDKVILQ